MKHTGHTTCECGGNIVISSDPLIGRTLERCTGPCGYDGPARPRLDIQPVPSKNGKKHGQHRRDYLPPRDCVEECGRKAYSPRAERCRPCANARHRKQSLSAQLRYEREEKERHRRAS